MQPRADMHGAMRTRARTLELYTSAHTTNTQHHKRTRVPLPLLPLTAPRIQPRFGQIQGRVVENIALSKHCLEACANKKLCRG